MNHYCTYFDRGFLAQGLALWRSLERHDPAATLWVLALDDFAAEVMGEMGGAGLRVVRLAEIEAGDAALAAAQANRSRVDYVFTLSPCWPRWLLARHPEIERVTYLDADLFFFGSPRGIFAAMDAARVSVLVTAHRFPEWLARYERHGKFNVGILSFRNDVAGRACLDDWRAQCLAWCHDRLEDGKYADQKYLDDWPAKLGEKLLVLEDAGVNLAPWNWAAARWSALTSTRLADDGCDRDQRVEVNALHLSIDGARLVLFHFARFRPRCGDWWWHSGQLEYGVMPRRLRRVIYAPYARALLAARDEIRARRPEFDFVRRPARTGRAFWQNLPLRLLFGGDWLWVGDEFLNLRLGLGRWSGQCVNTVRTIFLRTKRSTESASHHRQRLSEK